MNFDFELKNSIRSQFHVNSSSFFFPRHCFWHHSIATNAMENMLLTARGEKMVRKNYSRGEMSMEYCETQKLNFLLLAIIEIAVVHIFHRWDEIRCCARRKRGEHWNWLNDEREESPWVRPTNWLDDVAMLIELYSI